MLLLLLVATSHGYKVAITPSEIHLDHTGHSWVWLMNPNPYRVNYLLNSTSELSRYSGVIESGEKVRVGVTSLTDSSLEVMFSSVGDKVEIYPTLIIPIYAYSVSVEKGLGVMGVSVFVLLLFLFLLYKNF